MNRTATSIILLAPAILVLWATCARAQYLMENLGRGVVAIRQSSQVYIGWRLLGTDPSAIAFNLYRSAGDETPVKLNSTPIAGTTDYIDTTANLNESNSYFVRPVVNDEEGEASAPYTVPANAPVRQYLAVPLTADLDVGARHVGVGDLDGDGEYDFVVKRGNQDIDPSQSTVPTDTYKLEAYKRDGTFLWRVDLGVNIRPGVWYSPFVVFDLDGDGKAEVVTKIGEVDEDWNGDGLLDYTDAQGRALTGPEYFVVLDGETGQMRARADWIERGSVCSWGDCYGNRVDRHLMAVAYLDGQRPSLIILRGTYTKMYAEAWNFRDGEFTQLWRWSRPSGGGGFHNLRVGDIDGDGRDEIVNGSMAIDDDGSPMWITEEGHGDRMHMTDIDPDRPGREIFYIQESPAEYEHPVHLRDAATGALIWGQGNDGWGDVGRGLAADIDPNHRGLEVWASAGNLYNSQGADLGAKPSSVNFGIWWDGDELRELLDGTRLDKWDPATRTLTRLITPQASSGSRNAPMGYGDILGDWREEVWYVYNNTELRIYSTVNPAGHRFYTFMHDPDYRISVACETMGYMQATQTSFYVGADMEPPPLPNIVTAGGRKVWRQ